MEADEGRLSPREVSAHPLNLIGVDVGRRVFHRGRKIEDDFIFRGRLPDIRDRFTDFEGKIEFGTAETLG